jgi:hypothetical protein
VELPLCAFLAPFYLLIASFVSFSQNEFEACHLPGQFEPARAGKRMKLPTPETWETLLSEKGNKASTWEELIEHNKLPFMVCEL